MKLVRTENGTKLPASYRSGRFDEWASKTHRNLPKVGDVEDESRRGHQTGQRFRHNKVMAAKPLDKLRKDYEQKTRIFKKKGETAETPDEMGPRPSRGGRGGRVMGARRGGKSVGRVKFELKTVDQVRKGRSQLENRRAKTGRHSRGGGGGRGGRGGGRGGRGRK